MCMHYHFPSKCHSSKSRHPRPSHRIHLRFPAEVHSSSLIQEKFCCGLIAPLGGTIFGPVSSHQTEFGRISYRPESFPERREITSDIQRFQMIAAINFPTTASFPFVFPR